MHSNVSISESDILIVSIGFTSSNQFSVMIPFDSISVSNKNSKTGIIALISVLILVFIFGGILATYFIIKKRKTQADRYNVIEADTVSTFAVTQENPYLNSESNSQDDPFQVDFDEIAVPDFEELEFNDITQNDIDENTV